eukprot:3561497-Pyramimonas_sp.AAC.2
MSDRLPRDPTCCQGTARRAAVMTRLNDSELAMVTGRGATCVLLATGSGSADYSEQQVRRVMPIVSTYI